MKSICFLALILAASLPARGQTATNPASTPALPSDARAFFQLAVPHYDFSDPKLKPWHLKASYEIFDYEGKLATKGTWEYWWISPRERKRSWERPKGSRTDWVTQDCTIFSDRSGEPLDYFERKLEDVVLYPGPNYEAIESGFLKLSLKVPPDGSNDPTCLVTSPRWASPVSQVYVPSDYCFDPSTMAITISFSRYVLNQYSQFVKMQDRYVAKHVVAQINSQSKMIVTVESIEGIENAEDVMKRPSDAVLQAGHAHYTSDSTATDKVSNARLIKTTLPDTIDAKQKSGIVLLVAELGTDGKVRTLQVMSSPSAQLANIATDTVKRWVFQPEQVNGKPVESEFPFQLVF